MKRTISLVVCILLLINLTSCGAKGKPEPIVRRFCDAMQSYDLAEMQKCTVFTGDAVPTFFDDTAPASRALYQYITECASKMEYTIESSSFSKDTGLVTVSFSYLDATTVVNSAIAEFVSQMFVFAFTNADDTIIEATFSGMLTNKAAEIEPTVLKEVVTFPCKYTDDGWKITEVPEEILNILTCNIQSTGKALEALGTDDGTDNTPKEIVWHDVRAGTIIELATLKVRVLETKEATSITCGDSTETASKGAKFVILTVELENLTKDTIRFSMSDYPFSDSNDRTYEPFDDGMWILGDALHYTDLAPNVPQIGHIIYKVPTDSTNYHFDIIKADTTDGYRFFGNTVDKVDSMLHFGSESAPAEDTELAESNYGDQHTDAFDVGYVVAEGGLKVRSGPGTSYGEIARLPNGECVSIFEYQYDGHYNWGRIDRGWICTDYISYDLPSGTCATGDVPEDVFLRYEGKWGDRVGQRCFIEIWYGLTAFSIEISWSSSASESTEWSFTGVYDANLDSLTYTNGMCVECTYYDDGGVTESIRYVNGSGRFYLSAGEMYWEDYTEGVGSRCIFEKLQ